MIKECDICVFYYNKNYMPPKRKSCNRAVSYYIPKSGTALAYDFAVRVSGGHLCEAEAPTEPAGETAVRCAAIRSLLRGIRILSRQALRMTSRLLIFGFIFVTFVTARAYFAFMRMVYCIAANAACVFKVRAIPVYMVNGTLFGKIANGAFAQRNSLV